MPLLCMDLDNTLIDREAAFMSGARAFLAERGLSLANLPAVLRADAEGEAPREVFAATVRRELRLDDDIEDLVARFRSVVVDQVRLDPSVEQALQRARSTGWSLVIITNGTVHQQTAKVEKAGLNDLVDHVLISEEVGCRKPQPAIFEIASARTGVGLDGGWMIGDRADADIIGGRGVGMSTAWVSMSRCWSDEIGFRPDLVAVDGAEAIATIIG